MIPQPQQRGHSILDTLLNCPLAAAVEGENVVHRVDMEGVPCKGIEGRTKSSTTSAPSIRGCLCD